MKRDDGGVVNNPLRANIALTLERERARRGLSHMHMAELFRTAEGEKLAYRTYIQTVRQKNNVTLTTLQIMANGLQVSFAGLLAGGKKVPEWAHRLDDYAIRKRLEIYDRETAPLVEHYRAKHANVVGIHADQPVDDVFAEVREALEQVAARR